MAMYAILSLHENPWIWSQILMHNHRKLELWRHVENIHIMTLLLTALKCGHSQCLSLNTPIEIDIKYWTWDMLERDTVENHMTTLETMLPCTFTMCSMFHVSCYSHYMIHTCWFWCQWISRELYLKFSIIFFMCSFFLSNS